MNKTRKIKLNSGDSGHMSDLRIGQSAKVIALHNNNLALRKRLYDMGITKGVTVAVSKIAPLGDPYSVALRGYELCLRKADLKCIDIEVL